MRLEKWTGYSRGDEQYILKLCKIPMLISRESSEGHQLTESIGVMRRLINETTNKHHQC